MSSCVRLFFISRIWKFFCCWNEKGKNHQTEIPKNNFPIKLTQKTAIANANIDEYGLNEYIDEHAPFSLKTNVLRLDLLNLSAPSH